MVVDEMREEGDGEIEAAPPWSSDVAATRLERRRSRWFSRENNGGGAMLVPIWR